MKKGCNRRARAPEHAHVRTEVMSRRMRTRLSNLKGARFCVHCAGTPLGYDRKKMSTLRNETFQRTQSIASSRWHQMFLFYTGLLPRSTGAGGLPDAECHNHNKSHMLAQIGQYRNHTRHEHCFLVFICTLHINLHLNLHLD